MSKEKVTLYWFILYLDFFSQVRSKWNGNDLVINAPQIQVEWMLNGIDFALLMYSPASIVEFISYMITVKICIWIVSIYDINVNDNLS